MTSGCSPLGIIISVTSPDAGSISSYGWSITSPDGSIQTASSPTYIAIFSQPGTYDVTLTINGSSTTTITDYITVYGLPQANFTVDDPEGCFPLCVQFTDQSVPAAGSSIVEWSWDFGNGAVSSTQNPSYCYPNAGSFTPVLSIEDNHGCFDDITISGLIDVSSVFPNASFQLSSALDCEPPVSITLDNLSSGTGTLTSSWDFGDGTDATAAGVNDISHNYLTIGNYTACLTVSDQIGCEDTDCHPLTIFDTAQANFTLSDDEVCEGDNVSFTDITVPTPLAWQWDLDGNGTTDSFAQNSSFTYANNGDYSPSLIVTYSTTCADTLQLTDALTVIDGITTDFSGDTLASCQTPFTVTFTNESFGPGTLTYNWYINGAWVSSSATTYTHVFNAYGNYDIELEVSNEFGCTSSLLLNDYVIVQPPQVTFTTEASVCTGQNIDIISTTINSVDPIATWMWDFDNDGITDATGPDPVYAYTNPGTYTISLDVITENGCTGSYTSPTSVTVLLQVSTGFTSNMNYTCAGQEVEFCVEYQPGNTYSWNFGDDTGWQAYAYFDTCVTHDYADTGYFDVALSVFNGACNLMVTYDDFIYIVPPVALFDYEISCDNYLSVSFTDESIMADSLTWDFGDGSPLVINELNPIHEFPGPGEYTITLTAFNDTIPNGCPDNKIMEIEVEPVDLSLNLSPTSGCPTLMVSMSDNSTNLMWDVTVSNGDHIHVQWNEVLNKYVVTYEHDGITTTGNYGFNANFWPTLSFEESGYFDITVIGTNTQGCTDTLVYDDVIFVSSNPDFASFSYDFASLCDSVQIGFIPDIPVLENPVWTFSNGATSNEYAPYITFDEPYDYGVPITATLSASDTLGCFSEVTQTLDIDFPAIPDFIVANDPSCQHDTVAFINQSSGDIVSYLWDFGDPTSGANNFSSLQNPTHSYASNGTYPVCLTVENSSGCARTYCDSNAVHIVNPEINFSYTSSINNCLYGVQFENTTPDVGADVIFQEWDFGDGQVGEGDMVFHTYSIGVYNVVLVVMNEYACIDTLEVPDILNFGDVIGPFNQALDSALCAPFDVDFAAFNVADTYFDYFWDFDDGYGDPGGSTTTSHTYTNTGVYCPSIIMTDPNGCPVLIECTDSIEVTALTLEYFGIDDICAGDSLSVTIDNADTFDWVDDTYVDQTGTNTFDLFPPVTTDFILTGYFSDCEVTDTINIEVHQLPVVALDMLTDVCHLDPSFPLSGGTPADPPGQYFVDGNAASMFDPSTGEGQYHPVIYEYTDLFGCVNRDTSDVFVHPLPAVTLASFNESCENDPVIPMQGGVPAGGQYLYASTEIFSINPSDGDGVFPIVYFYTDGYGCSNSDNKDLVIHPAPEADINYTDVCFGTPLSITNGSTIPYETISGTTWDFGVYGNFSGFDPPQINYGSIGTYP
ncbi:MAG: PKD domain-containing protein, partial [Flavobacteriales bacterium]|nr:PKD domain-containing protein [Flavobacteriales bacterium]